MNFSFLSLKLRSFLWLIRALIKRYHHSLFMGFSVGLGLFIAIGFIYPFLIPHFKSPKIKKIGIVGKYTLTDFPLKIQNQISFGLTSLSSSGEATAAAAQNWDIEEEGKIYTFNLRTDLFWQDGKSLVAGDINYNLKDAIISTLDDRTIQIKLKEPFSPLPVLLSQPLFKKGLIGLGEYKVKDLVTKDGNLLDLTLEVAKSSNNDGILKYRFYPSEEKAVMAYKLGEIDIIEDLNSLSPFDKWPVKVESKTSQNYVVALFFNTQDSFLSAKSVRQALTYALPNYSYGERVFSPIQPFSWAYNDKLKKYDSDIEVAQKLFNQTKGEEKSNEKGISISTTASYQNLAYQIAKAWEGLGLSTEVKIGTDVPKEFQVLLAAQEIPPDPDQYMFWHSTQEKTNITNYKSPRIDKLLEDGRKTIDKDERRKEYLDFQKYLMDELPAAFLYYPTVYIVSRP